MGVLRLGNLSISQLIKITGWEFNQDDLSWLAMHKSENASFRENDKFHIFEIPFCIVAGKNIEKELLGILIKANDKNCSPEPIQILFENRDKGWGVNTMKILLKALLNIMEIDEVEELWVGNKLLAMDMEMNQITSLHPEILSLEVVNVSVETKESSQSPGPYYKVQLKSND